MTEPFKLAGVIGWPVAHSLSPRLHSHWLQQHGIAGAYVPMAVAPDKLAEALAGLSALGFRGCNVTVPHKEVAAKLVPHLSPRAARIGAVNTIVVRADGQMEGDSTDGEGFMAALTTALPHWPLPQAAVVVGAGGAARALLAALQDAGVKDLRLLNRTRERANDVAAQLGGMTVFGWDEMEAALAGCGLVVNSTTLGMVGQPELALPLTVLAKNAVVYDVVYNPAITPLVQQARALGFVGLNGLGMLLHQAVPGFERWFGVRPVVGPEVVALMEKAL